MPLTISDDTAFHESGHSVLAYLAEKIFEIDFVTVNKGVSSGKDSDSLGGLSGKLIGEPELFSFQDHDQIVLICMAGMAADDINENNGKVDQDLFDKAIFGRKINSKKYSGDTLLLLPHLQRIVPQLNEEQRAYTTSCQERLYDLFTREWMTKILVELRNKISDAPKQTLSGGEIFDFFNSNSELTTWKETQWPIVLEETEKRFRRLG